MLIVRFAQINYHAPQPPKVLAGYEFPREALEPRIPFSLEVAKAFEEVLQELVPSRFEKASISPLLGTEESDDDEKLPGDGEGLFEKGGSSDEDAQGDVDEEYCPPAPKLTKGQPEPSSNEDEEVDELDSSEPSPPPPPRRNTRRAARSPGTSFSISSCLSFVYDPSPFSRNPCV